MINFLTSAGRLSQRFAFAKKALDVVIGIGGWRIYLETS